MRAPTLPRVARSPPAVAVGRASVRALYAAAGRCHGTPSTMIAAGKLIDHEANRKAARQGLRSWRRPDKAGGSTDRCRSTTGWWA